jgi:hypothetical protein
MLVSWQLEQPPVTPEWVWVVLGGELRKPLLGAACGALPGTKDDGMAPLWQFSQVVELGMWLLLLAVAVGGMTTMLLMPWKVPACTLAPWHSAQLVFMPLWLKAEPENTAAPVTGVVAMLEPLPTWQLSQPNPRIGTWLLAGPTMVRLAELYVVALAALWHCAQLVEADCRLAWMAVMVGC